MIKKIVALLLAFMLVTNFLSVGFAKTAEEKDAEKQANKEYRLQKKRERELLRISRRENIKKVTAWAENGDIQAQMILSYAYQTGQRVKRDKIAAADWKGKVAELNPDLVANFIPLEYTYKEVKLPRLYGLAACRSQIGQYVDQNFDDAIRWAELGASELDTLSFALMGSAYYTGRGVRQDYQKAISYFKRAGDEPIALFHLSEAYAHGNGVDKDLERSKFYLDYLQSITQPKIDKQRDKAAEKLEKEMEEREKEEQEKAKQKEKEERKKNKNKDKDKNEDETEKEGKNN